MVLALLIGLITFVVGMFFDPPSWVMGCAIIAILLAVFMGDL